MNFEYWAEKIYCWQYLRTDSFSCKLIDLYQKADGENRKRLSIGFPGLASAMAEWSEKGDKFFIEQGFNI